MSHRCVCDFSLSSTMSSSVNISVLAFHAPFLQPDISLLKISLKRTVIREFQTPHVSSQMTNIPMYCPTHLLLQPPLCKLHVHNSLSYLGLGLPFDVCDQLAHSVLRSTQRLIRHNHEDHRFNRFFFTADIKMVTTPDHFLGYQVTQRTHPTVTTSNIGDFINFIVDDQVIFDEVTSTERSPSPSPTTWINRRLRPMDKLRKTEYEWVNTGSDDIIDQLEKAGCCSICLEEYLIDGKINDDIKNTKLVRFGCTHLYHLPCILQWLDQKDSCPVCRRQLYKLS
ncbi:hypothetical protein FNV43_RR09467 [Rhamnella rubrinervis]|uniref:RING-type E3 ubiquitin transferase n=1 Tax=Rhamnella rubrinervis TaxID=2594499 RepID=A0A8K0HBB6_9ROSA|nr:hypothetical protein FNV43_RR09467 [Rhamnella rubrinervis]